MSHQVDIGDLNVLHLAERCRQEADRSRRGLPHNPRYCFELFRRAIAEDNQAAWEAIYVQYHDLIRHWTGNPCNADDLIQETLARFSAAITAERMGDFPTLGSLLQFLRVTAKNLVITRRRRQEREQRGLDDWLAEVERQALPNLDARLDHESLMIDIRSRLRDSDEELVFTLTFEFDLSPQEIAARHPERFPAAEDVYRIKERFLRRLRRDPRLRHLVKGD
jgi:DNA-directed RNA polymerase specialized sigma24 family protein